VELSGGDRKLNLNIIKQQMSKTIYKITAMKFRVTALARLARVTLDVQIGAFRFVVLLENCSVQRLLIRKHFEQISPPNFLRNPLLESGPFSFSKPQ
jgi:hypothetical protein